MQKQKPILTISLLSDLHVAYVGNGCSVGQMQDAILRVKNIDPTEFYFGETFAETLTLNGAKYEIIDDVSEIRVA